MAKPLNDYREEQYMSVREFEEFLDISLRTFCKVAQGQKPRPTTIRRIAAKLQVHPSDISDFEIKHDPEK